MIQKYCPNDGQYLALIGDADEGTIEWLYLPCPVCGAEWVYDADALNAGAWYDRSDPTQEESDD